jgi:hypothetical protein
VSSLALVIVAAFMATGMSDRIMETLVESFSNLNSLLPVVPPAIIVLRQAAMTPREFVQVVSPLMVSAEQATTTGHVSIPALETVVMLMVTGKNAHTHTQIHVNERSRLLI